MFDVESVEVGEEGHALSSPLARLPDSRFVFGMVFVAGVVVARGIVSLA